MGNTLDQNQRGERQTVLWWVSVILGPIGVFGGSLSLASLASGIIHWNGPIEFLVLFWTNNISIHFDTIFGWIASKLHLQTPPRWLSDYLIFGVLFASRYLSAWMSIDTPQVPGDLPRVVKFLEHVLFWPFTIYGTIRTFFTLGVRSWPGVIVTFGSMIIFGLLWILNYFFA